MDLLSVKEINTIINHFGCTKVLGWTIENYSNEVIGYLGDHLKLKIKIRDENGDGEIILFVKCMPISQKWKYDYLIEHNFFAKEFFTLSTIFQKFQNIKGSRQWRPELLYIREDLFVFEDVYEKGYRMPHHCNTMTYDQIIATIQAMARFHAQTYVYEETKSLTLNRNYRLWEDAKEYLSEPSQSKVWRDVGRNAVITFIKKYSKYRFCSTLCERVDKVVPELFDKSLKIMEPSIKYRNTIIHRDLWTNNIFVKKAEDGSTHALIVDFQTVLYASPMLDLSSMIYFNTKKNFRDIHTANFLDCYYKALSAELSLSNIDVQTILQNTILKEAYEESLVFALTQAALIVPIVVMNDENRRELFTDPDRSRNIAVVSRTDEFVNIAKNDLEYRSRVLDLLEELLERYVLY